MYTSRNTKSFLNEKVMLTDFISLICMMKVKKIVINSKHRSAVIIPNNHLVHPQSSTEKS